MRLLMIFLFVVNSSVAIACGNKDYKRSLKDADANAIAFADMHDRIPASMKNAETNGKGDCDCKNGKTDCCDLTAP